MITSEMWQRAKEVFDTTILNETHFLSAQYGQTTVTRKQVEEYFNADDTPRHEISVKKNECPECFGNVIVMSDGSEHCCDCDYSINTNPCHSGDTKQNIDDLIKSEAVAFAEWCIENVFLVDLPDPTDNPKMWTINFKHYHTSELYQIYLISKKTN